MLNQLSDLDLRLIRVFLAVVDAGGISAAQAELNVSQSTISSQLATLETRLGFRLCVRGRAGFRLTPKGQHFAQSSRSLLESFARFCQDARQIGGKLIGTLQIGLIGHAALSTNARLSQAVARFRARDEAVLLSMLVLTPGQLEEAVVNGAIDVGIGYFWHRLPGLCYTPLYTERQVAYCGSAHPLFAQCGQLAPEQLADFDWVWRNYPLPELTPPVARVTALADNMEAVAVLVLSGRHLGYLPEHFAAPLVQQGLLAALNPARLHYEVLFQTVTRRQAGASDVRQAFLDDLAAAHDREPETTVPLPPMHFQWQ